MYGDERFMRLTPLQPSGQALWLYLLTGPHTGPIPGVFQIGRAGLAETLGWDGEAFAKAFAEVLREALVEFDEKTRLWFIPNAIKHNMPPNPNVVKSWRSYWNLLPECPMRGRIQAHLQAALTEVSDAFGKAFEEACGKPFETPSAKPPPKGMAKQETGSRRQETLSANVSPTPLFDRFWQAYPKKKARPSALKAFTKRKPTPELLDRMLAALEEQRATDEWQRDGGQFIPYPASWLNDERWMDEAPDQGRNGARHRPAGELRADHQFHLEA